MKKSFLVLSLAILFFSAIPRSIEVLSGNYLFGFDQGLFYQDVKKIVIDHKLTLIGSSTGGQGGLFQGPGWYYLLSIPFFLGRGDPYGGMVLMLIIGLLTVALSIYFGSKMFGKPTGLTIGFLIAVSPAIISQSRFIWPPFPVSLLTVFYLYFLYKVFQKKERFLPMATFVIGLVSHFELATAGTFFLQSLLIFPIFLIKKFASFKTCLFSVGTFLVALSPLIVFNFRHDSIILKGLLNVTPAGGGSEHQVTLRYIEHMFLNHLDVFRLNFISSFNLNDYLWPLFLGLLIFGGIFYIRDKKNKTAAKWFIFYLLTSPLTLFFVFMLYLWPIWQWWILQLIIFYNFAFGIISVYLFRNLRVRLFVISGAFKVSFISGAFKVSFISGAFKLLLISGAFKLLLIGIFLIFIVHFITDTVGFYRGDFNDYGGTAKIKGKIDAIDYIYKDAKGEKFGLLIFTPPIYTFPYDYLLWWYAKDKYKYIPHSEKKGLFYLLIEPDANQPWTYNGWLETVIKTGKVLETNKLPSGFIVQKRVE